MLKGEAKTAYMREYMRRRRAGLATAKPKPPWRPPQRMIAQIRHWGAIPSWRMRQPAHVIIDGLRLDTDDGVLEACRRYKRYLDDRRETKRREAEEREAAKRAPPECSSASSLHPVSASCLQLEERIIRAFAERVSPRRPALLPAGPGEITGS